MVKLSRHYLLVLVIILTLAATGAYFSYPGIKQNLRAALIGSKKPANIINVVVGCSQEPKTLNPYLSNETPIATKIVTSNILWGLLAVTPDLRYVPRIAEQVPTLENGLVTENPFTVIYNIRENAVWSDGTPITADDIKFTWQVIMDGRYKIADRSGYDKIERIDTPYKKTVRIVFKEPYANYKDLFSVMNPVLPKHLLENQNFNEAINDILPFASGPYQFKSWKHGDSLVITANKRFWGRKPYIKDITFKFVPDINKQLSCFAKGELDVIFPPFQLETVEKLKKIEGKQIEISPSMVWEQLAINLANPVLADINIRKAIAYTIDRKRIAAAAIGNEQVLDSVIMPEQKPFYAPAWGKYRLDIKTAREYLRKAGYRAGVDGIFAKDGKPLEVTITTTAGDKTRERVERIIKDNFEMVGIKLRIKNTDAKKLFNIWLPSKNYEIAMWAWLESPQPRLSFLFTEYQTTSGNWSYYSYTNSELLNVLKQIDHMIFEDEKSWHIRNIQDKLSNDLVIIPLYRHQQLLAYDKRVRGIQDNVFLEGPLWNAGDWRLVNK
ncbi:MAG: peptide ABC transporter substrate-binding protein [Actinomycetota bacterium]|nr:peptide ABC transporter substrate-binding protein [Actinomycetota bacterium]